MRDTMTVRWTGTNSDLGRRLQALSRRTNRSSSSYVTAAIADHIDRWEMEASLAERNDTITDAELAARLGLPEPTEHDLAYALSIVR
jgi:predicted transcriptional regulator